jgi:hypothetical protein
LLDEKFTLKSKHPEIKFYRDTASEIEAAAK